MRSRTVAKLKSLFTELQETRSSDHEIALGFSVGTFISVLPTPGFNILLGVAAVAFYPRMNRLAVFAAMALYNPIVMIPFYWASYALGALIFTSLPVISYDIVIADQVYDYTRRYLVGNLIVTMAITAITYPVVHIIASRWRLHNPSVPPLDGNDR